MHNILDNNAEIAFDLKYYKQWQDNTIWYDYDQFR